MKCSSSVRHKVHNRLSSSSHFLLNGGRGQRGPHFQRCERDARTLCFCSFQIMILVQCVRLMPYSHPFIAATLCCCFLWLSRSVDQNSLVKWCFWRVFPFSGFSSRSQSQIYFERSHSEHTHTQKKCIILFSCQSHEKIFSPKEQVRSSLSNDAIVSKQINLLWKLQGPAALSSEDISFVYWVVLLPDWCTNRGSANASWHLSYMQKKEKKIPLRCFLMREAAPNPNPLPA